MKRIILLTILLTVPAFGQNQATSAAAGCGAANVSFAVTTQKTDHSVSSPDPGKALVYVIQDDTQYNVRPRPSTRIGLDGTWMGATNGDSYFYFSVIPGEHHLCADWQSSYFVVGTSRKDAATDFTAEAGQQYYFRVQDVRLNNKYPASIGLLSVDNGEAQLLMSHDALSVSHPQR